MLGRDDDVVLHGEVSGLGVHKAQQAALAALPLRHGAAPWVTSGLSHMPPPGALSAEDSVAMGGPLRRYTVDDGTLMMSSLSLGEARKRNQV